MTPLPLEGKIKSVDDLAVDLDALRAQGKRVVQCHGVFDLLHPGHLSLLKQAKAACDRLVVGLNSDASVARFKGDGRPVQSEAARAAVLASLETVDAVVIFEDDTPLALIEALRPDVLVKGADWRLNSIVGGDFVKSYGGKVKAASLVKGRSTSNLIRKIVGIFK